MNHYIPPGIYAKHIARYCGTSSRKVEDICGKLDIERYTLGTLGREGPRVPFSIEQAMRIIGAIRSTQGTKLLGKRGWK